MRCVEALAVLACCLAPTRGSGEEAVAVPYEVALGAAPALYASGSSYGVGAAVEAEAATAPPWFPLLRVGAGTFEEDHPEDRSDRLRRAVDASLEIGARHYFRPFSHSWQASTSLLANRTQSTYQGAGGSSDVTRSRTTYAVHPAGGYRWLWGSGFFVLLGTGVSIPVYDVSEADAGGAAKGRAFWGPWRIVGMSALGVAL